ncbi:hypothetical protein V490_03455 [Pseudogymnoascus sp. VKM F-3557]|nr:hypothetical protein V490_03455 [Pseudogymnoascus sp. VKM F-3557]
MSKVIKQLEEALFKAGLYKKLFQKQTPGKRILPAQAKDNDAKFQLRIDAGRSDNGIKNVYLQVNSQAKNGALKEFKQKFGTDANLAVGSIDENTPVDAQEEAAKELWQGLAQQAKDNLGLRPGNYQLPVASISHEELFSYTNGHFLVDEKRQFDLRHVRFDLDALCAVSAAAGPEPSPITAVEKMEGGFSKALVMKRKNGTEYASYFALKVAFWAYTTVVRQNTDTPAPNIYSWSSDTSNSVGAEYIVMEKAGGVPLFQQWGNMTEFSKLELIKGLTKLEKQLASVQFPAYGSLYLRDSCPDLGRYQPLDAAQDSTGSYCVGPSCERAYILQAGENSTNVDNGPWHSISAFGKAIANREINRITRGTQAQQGAFYHGTSTEQIALLRDTIQIMDLLDTHPILSRHAQPIIWHSDLHMGNIFVSADDPSRIVSLIDWQSISILPAFLQAQWPEFLKPPSKYTEGFVQPKLPDDFQNLDPDEKVLATLEWNQAKIAKAYEVSNFLENRPAHNAMNIPRVFKELFVRCGEVSEYGVIPLRTCLIEIFQNWNALEFTGACPYSFTDVEIQEHESRFQDYHAWNEVQELARTCLDTDTEGWIPPELDFQEKQRQNKELLGLLIERMAGEKTADEAREMWPFSNGL